MQMPSFQRGYDGANTGIARKARPTIAGAGRISTTLSTFRTALRRSVASAIACQLEAVTR